MSNLNFHSNCFTVTLVLLENVLTILNPKPQLNLLNQSLDFDRCFKCILLRFEVHIFGSLSGKSHGWRSLVDCSPWGWHDWATSLSLFTFMHWRWKWQPTPVFLPGESQGRGSLVGCHLWGRRKSYTTEAT